MAPPRKPLKSASTFVKSKTTKKDPSTDPKTAYLYADRPGVPVKFRYNGKTLFGAVVSYGTYKNTKLQRFANKHGFPVPDDALHTGALVFKIATMKEVPGFEGREGLYSNLSPDAILEVLKVTPKQAAAIEARARTFSDELKASKRTAANAREAAKMKREQESENPPANWHTFEVTFQNDAGKYKTITVTAPNEIGAMNDATKQIQKENPSRLGLSDWYIAQVPGAVKLVKKGSPIR